VFFLNIKKITTILAYLADKLGKITKLQAIKLLYFIDKLHLIDFGRFVTNDTYIKLPYGPVPTKILDIINSETNLFDDEEEYLFKYLDIAKNIYRTITCKKKPDLSELSKSEIAIIDRVIQDYGKYSGAQLVDIAHREPAWIKAGQHDALSIEDMIEGLPDERKNELMANIEEDKETKIILHDNFTKSA